MKEDHFSNIEAKSIEGKYVLGIEGSANKIGIGKPFHVM